MRCGGCMKKRKTKRTKAVADRVPRKRVTPRIIMSSGVSRLLASGEFVEDTSFADIIDWRVWRSRDKILLVAAFGEGMLWDAERFAEYARRERAKGPEPFNPLSLFAGEKEFLDLVASSVRELERDEQKGWWGPCFPASVDELGKVARKFRAVRKERRDLIYFARLVALVGEFARRHVNATWRLEQKRRGLQWIVRLEGGWNLDPLMTALKFLGEMDNPQMDIDAALKPPPSGYWP